MEQVSSLESLGPGVLQNFQTMFDHQDSQPSRNNHSKRGGQGQSSKQSAATMTIEKKGNKARAASPPSITAQPETKQAPSYSSVPHPIKYTQNQNSLEERMNKKYSFKKEAVAKLFSDSIRQGLLILPPIRKPEEAAKTDHPKYCMYHRMVNHTLEDCFVFKDWVERQYQEGKLSLSDKVLQDPKKEHTNLVTVSPSMVLPHECLVGTDDTNWTFALSKKSLKLLRKLDAMRAKQRRLPNNPSQSASTSKSSIKRS